MTVPTPGAPHRDAPLARGGALRQAGKAFGESTLAVVGLGLIAAISLFCFVGPHVYHSDQIQTRLLSVNLRPGPGRPLGTDQNGYDVLGRLMAGGQISIEIGVAVAGIAVFIGVLYGAVAGFFGRLVDTVMMRFVDVMLSVPVVFVIIYLSRIYRPSKFLLIVILAAISWLVPARLVRGETLSLRTREYVQAARAMGGRPWRIISRHIIPNAAGTIVVNATFQVADAIIVLATLEYLGFSLPPPTPTWGSMVSDGVSFLSNGYWWEVFPALLMIVTTVISFNLIGDALHDALDVRIR